MHRLMAVLRLNRNLGLGVCGEDFGWREVAESTARSMVHKILDALNLMRGDGAEVDAFGNCLSKKTVVFSFVPR